MGSTESPLIFQQKKIFSAELFISESAYIYEIELLTRVSTEEQRPRFVFKAYVYVN